MAELKKIARSEDRVILATDPDREGEAIAAHIREILSDGKKNKNADAWSSCVDCGCSRKEKD